MRQLEKEKQKKEHILVCLSSSPSNEKIIRTAAQMAQAFQAGFTALYVQTAEKTEKTPEDWKEHDEAGLFPSAKGVDRASDGSCA